MLSNEKSNINHVLLNNNDFTKDTQFRRTFVVKKADLSKDKEMKKEIDLAFSDPSKYLEFKEEEMIVGRLFRFPRLDKNNQVKPHSVVGSPAIFNKKEPHPNRRDSSRSIFRDNSNRTLLENKTFANLSNKKVTDKNLDFISDRGLMDIYNKYMNVKKRNMKRMNDFLEDFDTKGKKEMKKLLLLQEKNLNKKKEFDRKSASLSKLIAIKAKKNEDEVLMNKTDGFRMRREIKNMIESQKPLEERYGKNYWMISLRRPDNFRGTRYAYVNIGNHDTPSWALIKEKIPENIHKETIRNPDSISWKEITNLTKSQILEKTLTDLHLTVNNLEKINNLNLIGKDLIQSEMEASLKLRGRKILHRKDRNSDSKKKEIIAQDCNIKEIIKLKI